jgi:biopolymer transport protein ExbD
VRHDLDWFGSALVIALPVIAAIGIGGSLKPPSETSLDLAATSLHGACEGDPAGTFCIELHQDGSAVLGGVYVAREASIASKAVGPEHSGVILRAESSVPISRVMAWADAAAQEGYSSIHLVAAAD